MTRQMPYPLQTVIFGILGPARLRFLEPLLSGMTSGRQELWRELRPLKIRWRKVLLLTTVIILLMGEWVPAASNIAVVP